METGYRCALDAKAQYLETWESVVSTMQVGSAIFETGSRSEGVVECRIAHKIWQVPATGPQYWTNVHNWLTALWLAMICRERGRARRLAEMPLELLRASSEQFDDFEFPWVESLQMFWRNEQGLFDKLMPAMKATAPEQIRVTTTEYALLQVWPTMRTFYHLVQGENEQFNDVLAEAVQLHKDYWTADEERAKDPDGFIALGPLAMACLARDWDVAVEVESEYLPEHLINGAWVGEFRT
ncbi:immunity 49 family protein [Actinomadura alba]|uniref:Immunity 49 family protein n=2 Tax=Actinomadura alba TaxID=406431 RepID=A0ABR7LVP3_9ACTN|nr:immunity 49 family protein [Actinomadura alba]